MFLCEKPPVTGLKGFCYDHADEEVVEKLYAKKREQRKNAINRKKAAVKVRQLVMKPNLYVLKKRAPINKASKKMLADLKIYKVLRKDFLKDHPVCECGRKECKKSKAVDIHHKKGRGVLLNVVEFWLPVARMCHRWITDNPKEAMELGLTISRLNIAQPTTTVQQNQQQDKGEDKIDGSLAQGNIQ